MKLTSSPFELLSLRIHYHLPPTSTSPFPSLYPTREWSRILLPHPYLPPFLSSSRGKIVALPLPYSPNQIILLLLLPMEEDLLILRRTGAGFEEVLRVEGAGGRENEVGVDVSRRRRVERRRRVLIWVGIFCFGWNRGAGWGKRGMGC